MADETKSNQALADMELNDNFFDLNDKAQQDAFQSEFLQPFNDMVKVGIDGNQKEGGTESTAGEEPAKKDDGTEPEPFKFDDVLAAEEAKELAELNAKLGSNFKDRNELDEALKKVEQHDQTNNITEEKKYINYFKDLLNVDKYPDDVLVREDKRLAAVRNKKNLNDPEVQQEIDYEVDKLSESGALSYAAQSIRASLSAELKEKQRVVSDFEQSQQLTAKQKEDNYKKELQEGINDIYKQGKFLGITPTKDDMLEVYKDISKNKHIEHLKAHPKDAVEFALFKKFKEVITKNLGKPNYEAGVKKTLDELGMSNSSQTGTHGNDITKGNDEEELSFLQRFAK